MSIDAISHHTAASAAAPIQYGLSPALARTTTHDAKPSPEEIKKTAAQFEAIIIRQLLAPSIEPLLSSSASGGPSAGGGVYSQMLTETLADSLARGGGLGLGKMLENQFSPTAAPLSAKSLGRPVV